MSGKVYIGTINLRGKWSDRPETAKVINVTSNQSKNGNNRRNFSPTTHIKGGYKGYWNFENYYQSCKVFENIPDKIIKGWWKSLDESGGKYYPGTRDTCILYYKTEDNDEEMDEITFRKKIFAPEYFKLMKDTLMAEHWKYEVDTGKDVIVYDFNGPRSENREPIYLEVSKELLKEKINDTTFPFGHGYIVAGWLLDLTPEDYIN